MFMYQLLKKQRLPIYIIVNQINHVLEILGRQFNWITLLS